MPLIVIFFSSLARLPYISPNVPYVNVVVVATKFISPIQQTFSGRVSVSGIIPCTVVCTDTIDDCLADWTAMQHSSNMTLGKQHSGFNNGVGRDTVKTGFYAKNWSITNHFSCAVLNWLWPNGSRTRIFTSTFPPQGLRPSNSWIKSNHNGQSADITGADHSRRNIREFHSFPPMEPT